MNYGDTLSKAWKVIWKNKILWLFGILAGFSSALGLSGGGGSSNGSSSGGSSLIPDTNQFADNVTQVAFRAGSSIENNPWVWLLPILIAFCLILFFTLASIFLGPLGTSGVIKGTIMADQADPESGPLSLKAVWKGLKPYYWKMVLFELAVFAGKLIIGLVLAALIIGLIVFTLGLGIFLLFPLIILVIPASLFIYLIIINSMIALIAEDLSVFKAFERGWQVTTKNLGPMIIMLLILGVGQFFATFIIILPIFASFIPLGLAFAIPDQAAMITVIVISSLLAMLMIFLGIFLVGVIRSYVLAAWTLNFNKCHLPVAIDAEKEKIAKGPQDQLTP